MTDFSEFITNGQNNVMLKCPFCNSSILSPNSAIISNDSQKELPTITQKKDGTSATMENVSEWWVVDDMFTFENIGFTHAVGSVKYLSCADCERGPIGYHDMGSKKNFVALIRVQHG